MTDRLIESDYDKKLLIRFIEQHPIPFVCSVTKGRRRSIEQNKLQRLWCNEIAQQTYQTPEEVRGYIKLTIGVPILRAESEAFRVKYDAVLKPLSYEQKIALMMEPLDLPVTRLFTSSQKAQFLDQVFRHFVDKGLELTRPEEIGEAA